MSLFGRLLGRQRTRWEETWHAFPGVLDDVPTQWTVDLGAVAAAPVGELPVRLDVEAAYAADPDGNPLDVTGITRIEDAVRACLSALGGEYVGRVIGGGRARFTGHIPAEPPAPVSVAGGSVAIAYDPHWAYVRDNLAPDERQHQMLSDLAMVEVLSGYGDPLSAPREVAHLAYFSGQQPAEQAAAELRADGFAAVVERDDEGEFALTALRRDPVQPPRVHDLAWGVKETVERHGGTYDGWNCTFAYAAQQAA
jgi:hypothetical protein